MWERRGRYMNCRNCLKSNVKLVKKWYKCDDCKYEWEDREWDMKLEENEYCEDCGHYYNLDYVGTKVTCSCECHD